MGLKLHQVKALPKVGEWVISEKLAICNTFRDNSHLLILSRWVISYESETSPSESSPKSIEDIRKLSKSIEDIQFLSNNSFIYFWESFHMVKFQTRS